MQPVFAQTTLTEAACADSDIDNDDDGLIEICHLEDLNAIRNNLTGQGTAEQGCPTTPTIRCRGYELVRDLDFTTTQSYVSSIINNAWVLSDSDFMGTAKPGWAPIGGTFSATFEGNGYSISNLHINRDGNNTDDVGLFAQNSSVGIIRNLGLRGIKIEGRSRVGGLVGLNSGGKLINVYVEGGTVSGAGSTVGLLVARNNAGALIINSYARGSATAAGRFAGGVCGFNFGTIRNSYAVAMATALGDAGGLVGENRGSVINSYSMGSAHITESGRNDRVVGGLVAGLFPSGSVRNSYSTAIATSARGNNNNRTGGLVGTREPISLVLENSYWEHTDNNQVSTPATLDGTSQTTAELRMPTAPGTMPTDVYYRWSTDDWDFGDTMNYPALRYIKGDDVDNPACHTDLPPLDMDSASLPGCGALLPRQSGRDNGLSILYFVLDGEQQNSSRVFRNQPFSSLLREYNIKIPHSTNFQLRPYAINSADTISVFRMTDSQVTDYFDGKESGESSIAIPVQADTNEVLIIEVGSVTYTLNVEVGPAARVRITDFSSTLMGSPLVPGSTVDEGVDIELRATIADGSGNYDYLLQKNGETVRIGQGANATETFNVVVPPDLTNTTQNLVYTLTVDDGFDIVSAVIMFMVNRVENGDPQLRLVRTPLLKVISTADDPDGVGTFTYQWQRQINDSWTDISDTNLSADPSTFALNETDSTIQYRVIVRHTDGQGNSSEDMLGPNVLNVDDDDDGLIEVYYLESLNAIRHQLNGTGYKESGEGTAITTGCPDDGCDGYELTGNLDFMIAPSYVSGVVNNDWVLSDLDFISSMKQGWEPIGATFSGIFEGNGYVISNLHINRVSADNIGLFAGNTGIIRNLGLSTIKIRGNDTVGGLVGRNQGNLINVYVNKGDVRGNSDEVERGDGIGLLIGRNIASGLIINSYARGTVSSSGRFVGGISGTNLDRVINSYAIADVRGAGNVGGLIGDNLGSIRNSYAMGSVDLAAAENSEQGAGGLVNALWVGGTNPSITNSYSTVALTGNTAGNTPNILGGLVATRHSTNLPVNNSYWDFGESNQIASSAGGTSQTTIDLQAPTNRNAATGIYANWSTANWDFGDTMSYPALRYAEGDATNPACDIKPQTPLPNCSALLPNQSGRDRGLSIVFFKLQGETEQRDNAMVFRDQPFSSLSFDYNIKIPHAATEIQLRPYSINNNATISVIKAGESTERFSGKRSGNLSDIIPLQAGGNEMLEVMVDGLTYNFNLVRGSQTPVEVVSFNTTPPNANINEGSDVTLEAAFRNGNGDYRYSFQQGDMVLDQGQGTNTTFTTIVAIPDTFVEGSQPVRSVVYRVTVEDGFDITSTELMVTVNNIDNGEPELALTVSPTVLRITSTTPDPDGVGTFTYQWQSRDAGDNSWADLATVNGGHTVSSTPTSTTRYRVTVEHTDGQGHERSYTVGSFPINVDGNDNSLIDIYYLEDLNVLRNQADGSGYTINPGSDNITVNKITLGCPSDGCRGYELIRNLDFDVDDSYVDATSNKSEWTVGDPPTGPMDTGWLPIATSDAPFAALFNGNNNKISNLQINRDTVGDEYIGLFAALSSAARIENVGILDVDIEGRGYVGSLVAQNKGTIVNSYVHKGEVMGAQHNLGGLVAINDSDNSATGVIVNSYADVTMMSTSTLSIGGLVGNNKGRIRNSYAAGSLSGACDVGGLVAENSSGSDIINGYASGAVSRSGSCTGDSIRDRVGGLVADNAGLIRNSYVRGLITGGGGTVGGLVAVGTTSTVEYSYWDSAINPDITTNTEAKISTELRTPTAPGTMPTDVYYQWSTADWDFGTSTEYPILRYNSPSDIPTVSACDDDLDTALPPCGGILLAQGDKGLSNLLFFANGNPAILNNPFSFSILSGYRIDLINKTMLELLPYGINPRGESISIIRVGDTPSTDYFMENSVRKSSGERSLPIMIAEGESILTISVGTNSIDTDPVAYSVTVNNIINPIQITSINIPDRVNEGPISLSATVTGGDPSLYTYQWTSDPEDFLDGQLVTDATLSFSIPNDFVPSGDAGRDVIIRLIVGDAFVQDSAMTTVTIVRIDNGRPRFTEMETVSTISIEAVSGSDPDGDGTIEGYRWQKRNAGTDWTTIDGETSANYSIPTLDKGDTLYRVRVASVDGQGNPFTSVLGPYRNRTDIDDDDDGFIDIYYLEDLNAVRHQPNGSGYQASSGVTEITMGCMPACMGYELRRDLDFTITENYVDAMTNKEAWTVDDFDIAGDTGWQPIGSAAGNSCSSTNCFSSTFEGNGHSIFNLQINRDGIDQIGMFGGNTGTIRNFGLREITVQGNQRVGGLVGRNQGNLINTYVNQGSVEGESNNVGGLAGISVSGALIINSYVRGTVTSKVRFVGGICGLNFGRIINSYADAMVTGLRGAGGLVGENHGPIINSYSMGSAHITTTQANRAVGGLVAGLFGSGSIRNSYSTAKATSAAMNGGQTGGLIGNRLSNLVVENSYWNSTVNDEVSRSTLLYGISQTTEELQMPTTPSAVIDDVYYTWSKDDWDFGNPMSYPKLLHNEITGVDACRNMNEETTLPLCNSPLPSQRDPLPEANTAPTITITPSVAQTLPLNSTTNIMILVEDSGDTTTLTAMSSAPAIVSVSPAEFTGITDNTTRTFTLNALRGGMATITFIATDQGGLSNSAALSVRVNTRPTISVIPGQSIRLLGGMSTNLEVTIDDPDADDTPASLMVNAQSDPPGVANISVSGSGATRTLEIRGISEGSAMITVMVDDRRGAANSVVTARFAVTVEAAANTTPTITITPSVAQTLPLNSTTNIMILVEDSGDTTTLTAMSSAPAIVSVSPAEFTGITDNTTRTFTLNALRGGMATITFTATDQGELSDSVALSVRVNTRPMISGIPGQSIRLLGGMSTNLEVTIDDPDADDTPASLMVNAQSDPPGVANVIVGGNGATRTLEISGISEGSAMITVTVDDGRRVANSVITARFTVTVAAANTTPTITITPSLAQMLPLNSTTDIMVLVEDAGDTATLTAMSSVPTIVSVSPAEFTGITDNTARVFMLNALRGGTATITFTATDQGELSDSVALSVRVNTRPMISGIPGQSIRLLGGMSTNLEVTIDDPDADDTPTSLMVNAQSDPPGVANVIVGGNGATRTLEISGISEGSAMITVMVDDRRGAANSVITARFAVTVEAEANTTPTITITPSLAQMLPLNSTTDIMVLVEDAGDTATLTAMSSVPTIVSVSPAEFTGVTDSTARVFMLNALRGGTATITFTATDQGELSDSVALSVRVNTQPTISGIPGQPVRLLEGMTSNLEVTIDDADADDSLDVRIDSSDSTIATATIIATEGATRTLEVGGVGAGRAMITVTVDDGRRVANSVITARFAVTVEAEANTAPTITITPSAAQMLPLNSTTNIMVSVEDAGDTATLTAMSSVPTIVSVSPTEFTGVTDSTARVFMLNALRGGTATITFTATDQGELSDSVALSVRVNTHPTISNILQPVTLTEGANTSVGVTINDADADDANADLMLTAQSNAPGVASVIVGGSGAIRTLEIRGISEGSAMITVMVDDRRGAANSVITARFAVTVEAEANTAPTITITPSAAQMLPLNSTTNIMVSVEDAGDTATLTAMSSVPTIVSVSPAEFTGVTDSTARVFMLNALRGGTATITFTATDQGELSDSVALSVRVNTPPMISGIPGQSIRLLEGMSTDLEVTIDDADADDSLDVRIDSSDSMIATATIIATEGATRTLEVSGVGVGSAMITVTVDDGRGVANSKVSAEFEVQVEANTAPTIMLTPSTDQTLLINSTAHIVVSVADDNFNLDDVVTLKVMSSSPTIVSVTPARVADITTDTLATFTLSANRAGVAKIEVTATDSADLISSGTVEVAVNTPPALSDRVATRIVATVGEAYELETSSFFEDADGDVLTYSIAIEPSSNLIDSFNSMTGRWLFTTTDTDVSTNMIGSTVTVSADDGRGGLEQATFTLLIDAPPTAVSIAPATTVGNDRWLLRATTITDANGIETISYRWFMNGNLIDRATENEYRIPNTRASRTADTTYRLEAAVIDNIEERTTLAAVYTVPNIAPMITRVDVMPSPTREGDTVMMTAEAHDENFDDLSYEWRVSDINADADNVSGRSVRLTIQDYFVTDATATATTANFVVIVNDGTTSTITMVSVVVNKEDNGVVSVADLVRSPTTETRLIFANIDKTTETDGGVNRAVTYHWQQCLGSLGNNCLIDAGEGSGWTDIAGQTGTLGDSNIFYDVPSTLSSPLNHQVRSGDRFRVSIAYTDRQDYTRELYSSDLGARLGQNSTPTIVTNDPQAITLLENGRITVDVIVNDRDSSVLDVEVSSDDDTIASAMISGGNATRMIEISAKRFGKATITATVDDGTGEANAEASLEFDVTVAKNTAPALSVVPSTEQTLPVNSTAHVVVSVADDNFNLDDVVTLEAVSSSSTVVSVTPARVADITTDTITTFMLSAEQGGTATIMFIATDIGGLNDSVKLSMRVNTAPTLLDIPEQPIRLLPGLDTQLDITANDVDADDSLDVRIDSSDSTIATATIIATEGATRTLEVGGVGAGRAIITVTVDDGRGVANSEVSEEFEVQVEANIAPTITLTPSTEQTLPVNSTAHVVVSVADDNFNLNDVVTLEAVSSSQTVVSLATSAQTDNITNDASITFTLTAEQSGTATIIFTATDIGKLNDSKTVSVNVVGAIRIRAKVFLEGPLQ